MMWRCLHTRNGPVAAMLLVTLAVIGGTGHWIWTERAAELARETQNIGSVSRVLADHVGRSVQAVDRILLHVAEDLSESPATAAWSDIALHHRLARLNRGAPQIRNMAVFNAKGDLVSSSSSYPPRPINVADRAYFREMTADPTQRLRFEGPFRNRVNGMWTVGFFRPVRGRDGRLRGLVYAALDTDYFRHVFGTVRQWSDTEFVLLGPGGAVLLRYPLEPDAKAPIANSPDSGAIGDDMIVSFEPVTDYSLVMVVNRSVRGALRHWRQQAWTIGAAASMLSLLLMLSALYVTRALGASAARERVLRDSERRYREMVDGSGLAIQISDDSGKRLYANQAFARLAGFDSLEELMASPPLTFVAPPDRDRVYRLHAALVGGEPGPIAYEFTAIRKDGVTFPVQAVLQRAEFDGQPAVQRTFIDLTALKRAEVALAEHESQFRVLDRISPVGIFRTDASGKCVHVNRAWQRISGMSREAALGDGWVTAIHPEDRSSVVAEWRRSAEARQPFRMEYRFLTATGTESWVLGQSETECADDGSIKGYVGTITDITERKRAEEALRCERDLANKVVEIAPVVIIILDRAGHVEHVNPYFEQLTGLSLAEARGRDCYESFLAPANRERLRQALAPPSGGPPTQGNITPILTGDGSECDIMWFGKPMTDDQGRPTGLLVIGQDVTEAVRAERELAERERSLANAQRIGHMGDWERNLVTGEVRWSDQVFRLLGRDRQKFEATFENVVLAAHPADREKVRTALTDALAAHASTFGYEARIILPDGEVRMIEQHAEITYAEDGSPLRANGIMHDVTERVHTEEALRRSEIRLRSIMDNMLDSIVVIDERGTIESVNRATYGVFGYENEGLVGKNVNFLMPDRFRHLHDGYLRHYLTTGESKILGRGPREVTGLTRDGKEVPLELGISEMRLGDRRYFIGTLRDITDRKIVEAQLRQAQKMEAVGQLTGGVAHDFNNLLAVISGNLEMLHEKLEDRPPLRKMTDTALRSVRRGADLTRSLLSYSRRQPMTKAVVDLNQVVSEIAELLRRMLTEAIEIRMEPATGLWPCQTDSTLLQTALINLALNARDAMPDGGKLVIGLANRTVSPDEAAAVSEGAPGDYIAISVQDSGIGMPRDVVDRVFEPFFTTKEVGRGTGLGLSMVYGFVKQSGGHVHVTSVPGSGTTITLLLPRDSSAQDGPRPTHAPGAPGSTGAPARILVVEDDPDIRALAATLLASHGYDVAEAEDIEPALAVLRDDRRFDLLLTDAVLRGKGARDFLADKACALVPGLRVLFISGQAETFVRGDRTAGDAMLLHKPFQIGELLDAVGRALKSGGEEDRSWVAAS